MSLPPRWQWKLDRWRERFSATFRAEPREARPRLCPNCGTLVGSTATKCHECGTSLRFSLAAASRVLGGLLPEHAPVTYVVLAVNGVLFVMSLVLTMAAGGSFSLFGGISGQVLLRLGAKSTILILHGEVWRLVTAIFLHGGIFHIGMNCLVLMDLGPQIEEIYGSARYLFLYIATGVVSFVVSAYWSPYGLSIGASGALMGLIGLMLAVTQRRGGAMMEMYRKQLLKWVVYIFIFGFLIRGIDNAAHFGGLAAGFLLGKIFVDREPMNATERKRAHVLGWGTAIVVVASFAAMLAQFFRTPQG